MSIRFQADNDLQANIVYATLRRVPSIDFRTAKEAELEGIDDLTVLARSASAGRVLVTHDKRTMPGHLKRFVDGGQTSPGVLLVIPQSAPIGLVVDAIELIWAASTEEEYRDRVVKIPF